MKFINIVSLIDELEKEIDIDFKEYMIEQGDYSLETATDYIFENEINTSALYKHDDESIFDEMPKMYDLLEFDKDLYYNRPENTTAEFEWTILKATKLLREQYARLKPLIRIERETEGDRLARQLRELNERVGG